MQDQPTRGLDGLADVVEELDWAAHSALQLALAIVDELGLEWDELVPVEKSAVVAELTAASKWPPVQRIRLA